MSATYWIQNSDFSSPDGFNDSQPVKSARQLIELLNNYDWKTQNEFEREKDFDGDVCCRAGMGILKPGFILHICPNLFDQTALIFFHTDEPYKRFGIFNAVRNVVYDFRPVPIDLWARAIELYMSDQHAALVQNLEKFKQ